MTNTRFLVRSLLNPSMIFCTDGEFHCESIVGPGGFCAKLYKTRRGAEAVRSGENIAIRQCDERGVEVRSA